MIEISLAVVDTTTIEAARSSRVLVILGLYWGIMENETETTIVYWGYIGIGLTLKGVQCLLWSEASFYMPPLGPLRAPRAQVA